MQDPQIVIVQFGSQYTTLIERTLRDLGFRSAILSPNQAMQWIRTKKPKAIIMSGSNNSVINAEKSTIDESILTTGIPTLGICYGMQLIVTLLGGKVSCEMNTEEYGPAEIVTLVKSRLFCGVPSTSEVWASHGDTATELPPGFKLTAKTSQGAVSAIESESMNIWGVQFHPEVQQTRFGVKMLLNFAELIAGCEKDWHPGNIVGEIRTHLAQEIKEKNGRAFLAFSGGVDSTTLAAIAVNVLGNELKAVCIDGGHLRLNESDEILKNARAAGIDVEILDLANDFGKIWSRYELRLPDAEFKRCVFSNAYRYWLSRSAVQNKSTHFLQGTLAPDMIESGNIGGDCIKTHHNVGVELEGCVSLHPFANLFKYEVRTIAESLGLPATVSQRQPFPGPGLFIRVVNAWPTKERLDILRWADNEVTQIMNQYGIHKKVSQLVVALDCGRFVGVKGDGRVYEHAAIIRGICTRDFMTGKGYQFPPLVREDMTSALVKHPRIARVFFDEGSKPPATVEYE